MGDQGRNTTFNKIVDALYNVVDKPITWVRGKAISQINLIMTLIDLDFVDRSSLYQLCECGCKHFIFRKNYRTLLFVFPLELRKTKT